MTPHDAFWSPMRWWRSKSEHVRFLYMVMLWFILYGVMTGVDLLLRAVP